MGKPAAGSVSESEWMTAQDVVDRLLAARHLKRLASTCVLPAVRRDGVWKFRRADLDAWIRERSQSDRTSGSGGVDGTPGSRRQS